MSATPTIAMSKKLGSSHCAIDAAAATIRGVYTLLAVLQVIIAGIVIFLILLHSGKDAGLSGAFGIGGGGSSFGGGSMVERNLDRATVFFAVLFVLNTVVLLKI
jgi:preprotein translocase subunit SecG